MMFAFEKERRLKTRGTNITVLQFSLLFLMKIVGCATAFVTTPAAAPFSSKPLVVALSLSQCHNYSTILRMTEKENEEENEKDDEMNSKRFLTYDELLREPELLRTEQEISDKRAALYNLPGRISKAITFTGWLCLAVIFALGANGYGFVREPNGWITIDTLERQEFLHEARKTPMTISVHSESNTFQPKANLMVMTMQDELHNLKRF